MDERAEIAAQVRAAVEQQFKARLFWCQGDVNGADREFELAEAMFIAAGERIMGGSK